MFTSFARKFDVVKSSLFFCMHVISKMERLVTLEEAARLHFSQTKITPRFKACGSSVIGLAYRLLVGSVRGDSITPVVYVVRPDGRHFVCDNRRECAYKTAMEVLNRGNLEGTGLNVGLGRQIRVPILEMPSCPGSMGARKVPQFSGQVMVKDLEDETLLMKCPEDYAPLLRQMLQSNPRPIRRRRRPRVPPPLERRDEEHPDVAQSESSAAEPASEDETVKAIRARLQAQAADAGKKITKTTAERKRIKDEAARRELESLFLRAATTTPERKLPSFEERLEKARNFALEVQQRRDAEREEQARILENIMKKHGQATTAVLLIQALAQEVESHCLIAEETSKDEMTPIAEAHVSAFMTLAKRDLREMLAYISYAEALKEMKRVDDPPPPPADYLIMQVVKALEAKRRVLSLEEARTRSMDAFEWYRQTVEKVRLIYPKGIF